MIMIREISKPELSPNFTIGDIHKIREWHYEKLKEASPEERRIYYKNGADTVQREIEARKAKG